MRNLLSALKQLGHELYSLPSERPLGTVGLGMLIGGGATAIASDTVSILAHKWVYPFYAIAEIATYVALAGVAIWTIDIFRRYRSLTKL